MVSSLEYELIAVEFGKVANLEDLEKKDASGIWKNGRINAKEVLISPKRDDFTFPVADGTAKLPGRDYEHREPTLRRERTVRSEDFNRELQSLNRQNLQTKLKPSADFWSTQGDFIYRHHHELRVQLYVPKDDNET